jgi:hypothetical protein
MALNNHIKARRCFNVILLLLRLSNNCYHQQPRSQA